MQNRTQLLLGRGDADELIDGSGSERIETLPGNFNDVGEDDWLIGLGFSRNQNSGRGWNFTVGLKLRTPVEPYARATYRWNRAFADAWLWQVRPRVFVQSERGAGASLTNTLDYAATQKWMLRSWTHLLGEEDVQGLGWTQKFTAFYRISPRTAMSYSIFADGQTAADVPLQDYGFELRWRRRIAREWLFLELLTFVNWPRELLDEVRETNLGVGMQFEMQFGDWPGRPQQ